LKNEFFLQIHCFNQKMQKSLDFGPESLKMKKMFPEVGKSQATLEVSLNMICEQNLF